VSLGGGEHSGKFNKIGKERKKENPGDGPRKEKKQGATRGGRSAERNAASGRPQVKILSSLPRKRERGDQKTSPTKGFD